MNIKSEKKFPWSIDKGMINAMAKTCEDFRKNLMTENSVEKLVIFLEKNQSFNYQM